MEWNDMERSGREWNENVMEWNGVHGMDWNGVEWCAWNRME